MKTHVQINGKEIALIQEKSIYDLDNEGYKTYRSLNEPEEKINELLLALDGLSFEKKEDVTKSKDFKWNSEEGKKEFMRRYDEVFKHFQKEQNNK